MEQPRPLSLFIKVALRMFPDDRTILIDRGETALFLRNLAWNTPPVADNPWENYKDFYLKILLLAGCSARSRIGCNPFTEPSMQGIIAYDLLRGLDEASKTQPANSLICDPGLAYRWLYMISQKIFYQYTDLKWVLIGISPIISYLDKVSRWSPA